MLDLTFDNPINVPRLPPELAREMARLRKTGAPSMLDVAGRRSLVVQSAAAYRQLLKRLERAESLAGLAEGLEEADRGGGEPASKVFADLRRKHGRRRGKRA